MNRSHLSKFYINTVIAIGGIVLVYATLTLPFDKLDRNFLILAFVTIMLSSRMTVQIPRTNGHISVSDTLIFLTLLLYGGEAGILVAAAEGLGTSLLLRPKAIKISTRTVAFNCGMLACVTLLTVASTRLFFGNIAELPLDGFTGKYFFALFFMGLVQYVANSGMAALHTTLKGNKPFWHIWKQHYLWASITYFGGVSAAGLTARIVDSAGFYSVAIVTPLIAIIFLTYRMYMQNVEASATAAKAEQAQQHIEELNHYIAEQERMREQLNDMEKMSALGELASGVAHDFNNTLAGILGRAQLLLKTEDSQEIKKGLDIIIKTTEDGAKTVKRIQDFARQRRDQQDFIPVAVDQLLWDVSEITRPRWKDLAEASNVQINLELQIRSRELVMGDASELREVLVNMVINAVDAMPNGGTLTLSVEDVKDFIQIGVTDTGIGMPPEVYSRIFDPFFTTKGKAGMGLGLAVSYSIVRRHEGFIEVSSEVGRGSSFRINLPIAKGVTLPVQQETSTQVEARPVHTKSKRRTKILVVDDEEHVRELIGDILEAEGCQVFLAERGQEALEILKHEKVDGIFTDVGMPGMSGWELAEVVRQTDKRIPIALVTGWGDVVSVEEQKDAAINWVVPKPFNVDRIIEITTEITKRRENNIKLVA